MRRLLIILFILPAVLLVVGCANQTAVDEEGLITNSIGMKLRLLKAGTFQMGWNGEGATVGEKPPHQVRLTRDFYIGLYPVTQAQFEAVMDTNTSQDQNPDYPVESIPKWQAELFCQKLSEREGVTYRLPTDAEWEYACRAGSSTAYPWGDEFEASSDFMVWAGNSEKKIQPVGTRRPNAWGLYDMPGNTQEWVSGAYGRGWPSAQVDPTGPENPSAGRNSVLRGCAYLFEEVHARLSARSSFRFGYNAQPDDRLRHVSFRVVREVDPAKPDSL